VKVGVPMSTTTTGGKKFMKNKTQEQSILKNKIKEISLPDVRIVIVMKTLWYWGRNKHLSLL
jgi:hypothetical protein